MSAAVLKSKEFWTPDRRLMAGQSPGRAPGRLPGGHVGDRADLKKALILCADCLPKFNHIEAGYTRKPNLPVVSGRCDGCTQFNPRAHLLVHHSVANLVR